MQFGTEPKESHSHWDCAVELVTLCPRETNSDRKMKRASFLAIYIVCL
jgi:hypothetical protein